MDERKYYLNAMGICCNLGRSKQEIAQILFSPSVGIDHLKSFLRQDTTMLKDGEACYLGRIEGDLPQMPDDFIRYNSRNNRMMLLALFQIQQDIDNAIEQYGEDRIGVILGSSTSGIEDGENALFAFRDQGTFPEDYNFGVQEIADGSEFLASYLGLGNIAVTISTACSSSAKVFAYAQEMMDAGICDAVIVGGMDSLCHLTCEGFHSLGALSANRCNPFSKNRNGISIGEGGALFLMTSNPAPVQMVSVGESSDGYSMTAPEPQGLGAEKAMRHALQKATLSADQIAYVNLHGTSTPHNDSMESQAVSRVFGDEIPCSSSKSIVGHTLGAAGATEIALCWLMMSRDYNPHRYVLPHLWDGERGDDISLNNFAKVGDRMGDTAPFYIISNFCAFGGSNASVILKYGTDND